MKITYYGHSCFAIEVNGSHILFDPYITPNENAAHIDIDSIKADYICVSHAHADHTADLELMANKTGAKIIGSWELVTHFGQMGYDNGHPMNFGGSYNFDFGKLHFLQAAHTSSFPDGKYGGAAGGFLIEAEGQMIYYSGDTGLMNDMKLFGEIYKIDYAILPIGGNFTMDADQAMICSDFIKCNKIIGVHYNTFPLLKINEQEAVKKFSSKGKTLVLLTIGAQMDLE